VHRARFLNEMVKLLPKDIARFGKRLVSIEDRGDEGGMQLKFRDGTVATHTAVIGCDGIKSETRKYILGRDNPAAYAQWAGNTAIVAWLRWRRLLRRSESNWL
jgi:salicylate hydroxylase